jgi:hypothetical protein
VLAACLALAAIDRVQLSLEIESFSNSSTFAARVEWAAGQDFVYRTIQT